MYLLNNSLSLNRVTLQNICIRSVISLRKYYLHACIREIFLLILLLSIETFIVRFLTILNIYFPHYNLEPS